jgi:hypothetical protein
VSCAWVSGLAALCACQGQSLQCAVRDPLVNSRPLRFGMTFLRQDNWDCVVEQVERYEVMGLDSAWVADHFVFPWDPTCPWLEAWSLLGALAARTRRIQLGIMVSHVIYRNPAVLARTAMTVDRISNGRLQLGLGTGASEYDWRLTGCGEPGPFAERVDRFVEAIEIVDGLLGGTMTAYQGRFYQVQDACRAPGPVQQPRPRLLVTAGGQRMVKLAARLPIRGPRSARTSARRQADSRRWTKSCGSRANAFNCWTAKHASWAATQQRLGGSSWPAFRRPHVLRGASVDAWIDLVGRSASSISMSSSSPTPSRMKWRCSSTSSRPKFPACARRRRSPSHKRSLRTRRIEAGRRSTSEVVLALRHSRVRSIRCRRF